MNLVEVVGIRLDDAGNAPMLILQEVDAPARKLEIWIGAVEAGAIAFAEQGITPARPLTHDLSLNLLTAAGVSVVSVSVTDIQDSIFLAEIELSNGQRVSARPSDAVAIALRASVSIFVAEHVLAVAGTVEAVQPISQEEDLEAFRSFLEDLNPEDFEKDA
jgi:hypothetical protein